MCQYLELILAQILCFVTYFPLCVRRAEKYWKQTVGDLSDYAKHAKRKGIEEADLQLLMTR